MNEPGKHDVFGFEGLYYIYDDGRVQSARTGRFLRVQVSNTGYLYISLRKNNRNHGRFIHRLLMQSWTKTQGEGLAVNHKDGVRQNNTRENLEWVTYSQNSLHSVYVLGNKNPIFAFGVDNCNSKAVEAFDSCGNVVHRFGCIQDAKSLGFQPASIAHAMKGRRQKSHAGYLWRYATEQFGQ